MSNTAKILYSGFYDFPLAFTPRDKGVLSMFVRDFDHEQDEYESEYRVFVLPPLTDEEIQSSWLHIESRATATLGTVADILDQFADTASPGRAQELAGASAR